MADEARMADKRRIILLFDGTWNDAQFRDNDTNIVRLREIINTELQREREELAKAQEAGAPPPASPAFAKTLVYYRRGVGTDGRLDRILGGMLGFGLADNVRRGYRFLAHHYQPGDEVYVFGFSRGAFTARSLVGYLGAAGLLRRHACTPELERAAWSYYRTPPDDRQPGTWHALGRHMHLREAFRVRALCVFDTVGALGIPTTLLRAANRLRYEFHDVEMPSITDVNLHAVAIDEPRVPFAATLWRRHKFKRLDPRTVTEQVWFAGVHADVGGGYIPGAGRKRGLKALDDITLDWMLRRVRFHIDDFPVSAGLSPAPGLAWSRIAQHQPRTGLYRWWPPAHRAIANRPIALPGQDGPIGVAPPDRLVSHERHQAMVGEMVHISAIERLGRDVPCGTAKRADKDSGDGADRGTPTIRYAPPGLRDALDDLAAGCRSPTTPGEADRLRVVGWDGFPIDSRSPGAAAALAAIDAARRRLAPT
jgi:hypothetical protein